MLRCANGHGNPDAALFCATCQTVMPPMPRVQEPPWICWRDDGGEPEAAAPASLEDEAFGPAEESTEATPAPRHRRRPRWRPRRSHPTGSAHDRV